MAFPQVTFPLNERTLEKIVAGAEWKEEGCNATQGEQEEAGFHRLSGTSGIFTLELSSTYTRDRGPKHQSIFMAYEFKIRVQLQPAESVQYRFITERRVNIKDGQIVAASTKLYDASGTPHHLMSTERPDIIHNLYDAACRKLPQKADEA